MSSVFDDELLKRQIYLAENYRFGRANLKVSQIFGGHGYCRAEIFGRAGARPSKKIRRLKSALSFFVINYGLKSVAWLAFGCVIYGLKPVAWESNDGLFELSREPLNPFSALS